MGEDGKRGGLRGEVGRVREANEKVIDKVSGVRKIGRNRGCKCIGRKKGQGVMCVLTRPSVDDIPRQPFPDNSSP